MMAVSDTEIMFWVVWEEGRYQLRMPQHLSVSRGHVEFAYDGDGGNVVMQWHSHCGAKAFWSATDNAEQQDFCLYGVLGNVYDSTPSVKVRLGVYGQCKALMPWSVLDREPVLRHGGNDD